MDSNLITSVWQIFNMLLLLVIITLLVTVTIILVRYLFRKRTLHKTIFLFLSSLLFTTAFAQEIVPHKSTWQQQLEYAKKREWSTNKLGGEIKAKKSLDDIHLLEYSSIGTVNSAREIPILIEKLFSGESFVALYMNEENFEIVPIATVMQNANLSGHDNPFFELISQLEERVQVGMEIIELKWRYKDKIIYSTGIASKEQGGMIYDHIGHFLATNTVSKSDD